MSNDLHPKREKPGRRELLASDFVLPVYEERCKSMPPLRISWSDAMRHFAPTREYYMRHFDSPEKRLRDKNPERFQIP